MNMNRRMSDVTNLHQFYKRNESSLLTTKQKGGGFALNNSNDDIPELPKLCRISSEILSKKEYKIYDFGPIEVCCAGN